MSNVYIRSQNREKLYIFGISFNSLQYEEQHDYKRGEEAAALTSPATDIPRVYQMPER